VTHDHNTHMPFDDTAHTPSHASTCAYGRLAYTARYPKTGEETRLVLSTPTPCAQHRHRRSTKVILPFAEAVERCPPTEHTAPHTCEQTTQGPPYFLTTGGTAPLWLATHTTAELTRPPGAQGIASHQIIEKPRSPISGGAQHLDQIRMGLEPTHPLHVLQHSGHAHAIEISRPIKGTVLIKHQGRPQHLASLCL
jgi:hypothetical protein